MSVLAALPVLDALTQLCCWCDAVFCPHSVRFPCPAVLALQEVSEDLLHKLFGDALLCALHVGRETLFTKDMALAMRMNGMDSYCR